MKHHSQKGDNDASMKNRIRTNTTIIMAGTVLALSLFLIDIFTRINFAGGIPYLTVIVLALCSTKTKHAIYFALGTSVLIVLGSLFAPDTAGWHIPLNRRSEEHTSELQSQFH